MRRTLLSLLIVGLTAGSLFTTSVSALEKETSKENTMLKYGEAQNLYPNLKGDDVVSIGLGQFSGRLSVSIEFNTDDDYFGDMIYFYRIRNMGENLILLKSPFAVTIDRNRNRRMDEDELFFLERKIPEESESEKPTEPSPENAQELYPDLKANNVVSIGFEQYPRGWVTFIQYNIHGDSNADIMYAYPIGMKIGDYIILKDPFAITMDKNKDGVFSIKDEKETFYLDGKTEESKPEKPTKYSPKKGRNI